MTLLWFLMTVAPLALQGHERILHIGCGDGRAAAELALQVPEGLVMSIDLSEEVIALAEERYDPELLANLQFQRADLQHLPFCAQFDCALGCAESDLLTGIAHALKEGSLARLSLPHSESLETLLTACGFHILAIESSGDTTEVLVRR